MPMDELSRKLWKGVSVRDFWLGGERVWVRWCLIFHLFFGDSQNKWFIRKVFTLVEDFEELLFMGKGYDRPSYYLGTNIPDVDHG